MKKNLADKKEIDVIMNNKIIKSLKITSKTHIITAQKYQNVTKSKKKIMYVHPDMD